MVLQSYVTVNDVPYVKVVVILCNLDHIISVVLYMEHYHSAIKQDSSMSYVMQYTVQSTDHVYIHRLQTKTFCACYTCVIDETEHIPVYLAFFFVGFISLGDKAGYASNVDALPVRN